jgi:hypothetical protein
MSTGDDRWPSETRWRAARTASHLRHPLTSRRLCSQDFVNVGTKVDARVGDNPRSVVFVV